MKALTVQAGVADREITPEAIGFAVNKELKVALSQARDALNFRTTDKQEGSTASLGSYQRLWTSETMPTNATWFIRVEVSGIAAAGAVQAAYFLRGCFVSVALAVSQLGSTVIDTFESAAECDARFGVDAAKRQIYVEARDDGVNAMKFKCVTDVLEATP